GLEVLLGLDRVVEVLTQEGERDGQDQADGQAGQPVANRVLVDRLDGYVGSGQQLGATLLGDGRAGLELLELRGVPGALRLELVVLDLTHIGRVALSLGQRRGWERG